MAGGGRVELGEPQDVAQHLRLVAMDDLLVYLDLKG